MSFLARLQYELFAPGVDIFSSSKSNNLDLVRLSAAIMVIFGHSYAISPMAGHADFITILTGGAAHSGSVAVAIFFFISGALVTKSMFESSSIWSFTLKRVARIWPALIICVLFSTLVLATVFGGSDHINYKELLTYIVRNIGNIHNQHFVTGLYEGHPNRSLNGSLWSLTLEGRLYFVLFLAMAFGLALSRNLMILFLFFLIAGLALTPDYMILIGANYGLLGDKNFPFNSIIFLAGALFYLFRADHLNYFVMAVAFLAASKNVDVIPVKVFFLWLFVIAATVFVIKLPILFNFRLPGDYSYGVYLYGWPAQQVVYSRLPGASPEINFIFSTTLALALAALSWHYLEKTILRKVRSMSVRVPIAVPSMPTACAPSCE